MSPLGKKLVHLDLKGAPPKFDYLLKVGYELLLIHFLQQLYSGSSLAFIAHFRDLYLNSQLCSCQQLIHVFADLGANGLLIEYEDMFPYEGDLEIIRASAHPPYRYGKVSKVSHLPHSGLA